MNRICVSGSLLELHSCTLSCPLLQPRLTTSRLDKKTSSTMSLTSEFALLFFFSESAHPCVYHSLNGVKSGDTIRFTLYVLNSQFWPTSNLSIACHSVSPGFLMYASRALSTRLTFICFFYQLCTERNPIDIRQALYFQVSALSRLSDTIFYGLCNFRAGGLDSGVLSNTSSSPVWTTTITNATASLWFYCTVGV